MSEFNVGDTVQLSVESVEFYENDPDGKYRWLSGWEWGAIYVGPLTIKEIIFDDISVFDDDCAYIGNSSLYAFEELDKSFYEFELELAI
jgi:hypothetical protein